MANDREFEFEDLLDTDAFLDALAQGEDPSHGEDELSGLLLGLQEEVRAPLPPTPRVEELLGEVPPVLDLNAERENIRRRRLSGLSHSLVGAAAATVLIAGAGASIYNASPGSPLWGLNQALFTEHAAVVELATTLDEMDERSNSGDVEGALSLLDQAKAIVGTITENSKAPEQSTVTVTATVTSTAPAPAPAAEPSQAQTRPQTQESVARNTTAQSAPSSASPAQESAAIPTTVAQPAPDLSENQQSEGQQPQQGQQSQPTQATPA
ncbi:MAG: hypothetical protein Q3972_00005, partial [Corynebacterium sp.]|nr:hypothetical protein [Corynebacterium sp.]